MIVSHVVHYQSDGLLYAYAPYAREIEIWAGMFENILIAAPFRRETPPGDCAPFQSKNIRVAPQRELGGETLFAKIKLIAALPLMVWDLGKALRQADAVQVRCPGNLGLLGVFLAPLFSRRLVAKFAGQWNANPKDPMSVKFQKWLLGSRWWRGPVTVYGRWPNQPAHVIPFFNSVLSNEQIRRGRAALHVRQPDQMRNVLFVGRLTRSKNVSVLLQALAHLRDEGLAFTATILGDGPEQSALQQLSSQLKLTDRVVFEGGVSFSRVVDCLERSGILVLASHTEGWPKAIVEGMAFGLVSIGSNVGLIPEILSEGRGLLVKPGSVEELQTALRGVLASTENYSDMRSRAVTWAGHYSIESLRDSLGSLLAESWGVAPQSPEKSAAGEPALCTHE